MIKVNRLKNLSILKNKFLNTQKNEINTLSKEYEKCFLIKDKLKLILSNIDKNNNTKVSILREKNKFNLKILEQITIVQNRINFLELELKRAKVNLGKLIKQKEKIETKLNTIIKNNLELREKKYLDSMPPQRNI